MRTMEFTYSLTWVDLMSMAEDAGCVRGAYPPMVSARSTQRVGVSAAGGGVRSKEARLAKLECL